MMGAAWGVGALAPQALRPLAQAQGFQKALVYASIATLLSAVCAYFLPREERPQHIITEVETVAAVGD
jgi:hypothetical protein